MIAWQIQWNLFCCFIWNCISINMLRTNYLCNVLKWKCFSWELCISFTYFQGFIFLTRNVMFKKQFSCWIFVNMIEMIICFKYIVQIFFLVEFDQYFYWNEIVLPLIYFGYFLYLSLFFYFSYQLYVRIYRKIKCKTLLLYLQINRT